jgi:hypothetical protein
LTVLAVRGFPVDSHWYVLHPRGKRLSPLAQAFLAQIGEAPAQRR